MEEKDLQPFNCKHCKSIMHPTSQHSFSQPTNFQYIDPVTQVLMDFVADLHEENPHGKTKVVQYSEWTEKVRDVMSEEINARYDLVPKDNDELKDFGHVKEDFLK